jgi:CheY-like chemotaxis protein
MSLLSSPRHGTPLPDTLTVAREMLLGKRAALIGFPHQTAEIISHFLTEAHGFARLFPFAVDSSADVLKPFELVLVSVDDADGSNWLAPEKTSPIADRSIGVGSCPVLLQLLGSGQVPYREVCIWPATRDEFFLRCISALRSGYSRSSSQCPADNSRVVLADDDPSITSLLALTLQRSGFSSETVSDGAEALYRIEKLNPCAAVLDVGMPGLNGFEILARLKSNPHAAETKVILLTGFEQEIDIVRGFSLGADDYVTKPFNPMEVLMRLKRAVGRI